VIPEGEAASSRTTFHTHMFPLLSPEYRREPSWLKHNALTYDECWSSSWSNYNIISTEQPPSTQGSSIHWRCTTSSIIQV